MSAKWNLLCFRSQAWSRGSFRTCHWLAKWIRCLADCSVTRSAELNSDFSDLFSLCFWTRDTLDPCSDSDINNDVSSLYVEIIDKNRSYYKCTICGRKLSRKQVSKPTWVVFMAKVRNNTSQSKFWKRLQNLFYPSFFIKEGYHSRKYKRCIDDPSVQVPKSTKLDRSKRSATRSNTAISIPQSVVSTELKAVVTTE